MKKFLMLLTIIGAVAYGAEYRNGTYRDAVSSRSKYVRS